MQIRKAVITAAGQDQRTLPLQTLFDEQGTERSVLSLVVREAVRAGIAEICIVVCPGDEEPYARLLADVSARLTFVQQKEARGYAHAVYSARSFAADEPFLHFVGDHIYVSTAAGGCAKRLVEAAHAEGCAISAVQVTRESLLPHFGAVGGQPEVGKPGFYRVDTVIEKPTPTEAEQRLTVPGLRSGQYLCFFGMHVLTPAIFEILEAMFAASPSGRASLSSALAALAHREQYLALIQPSQRFDVGVKYGLFTAQLALALNGQDRDEVLTELINI
ncbi:MAG: sugar phosphate nucleotidyltransferase, partial [Terracidiphilus sp.]